MGDEGVIRRSFLFLGIALTLFGCIIAALGIALPAWQVVELAEFNAIHEHGIFYDCIRSETYPLDRLRQAEAARQQQQQKHSSYEDHYNAPKRGTKSAVEHSTIADHRGSKDNELTTIIPVSPFSSKKCIYKLDSASSSTVMDI